MAFAASAVEPTVIEFTASSTAYPQCNQYNETWESTDGMWKFSAFSNNNLNWAFIASGNKNYETTPTFQTLKASEAPIDNIVVSIDARYTASAISAATLYVADNAEFEGATETDILSALPAAANSDMTINVGGTAAGQYVKVQFTIPKQGSNGQAISISKIVINYVSETPDGALIIKTAQDLVNMNSNLKAEGYTYIEFDNDIDMEGVTYTVPAQTVVANVHIDGKNHVIKNLKANGGFSGLFALMNGSVKNLGFVDIDLTCSNWGGCGAIAGYIANDEPTTIENCFVTGKMGGTSAQLGAFASGVKAPGATISNCYSTATLTSTGGGMQGGLIGAVAYAEGKESVLTINNSYFAGSIVNGGTVGGLVGANQSHQHPATGTEVININNSAVLAASLNGVAVNAIANTVGGTATLNAKNVSVAKTTVNGAAAAGVAIYDAIPEVMAWSGFNSAEVNEKTNLPILAWQTGKEYKADGSEYAPYKIATVEDLCGAWELTKANEAVYFVQTADIDMKGVTEWHALVGWDNVTYSSKVYYDGNNHLIKNFTSPNEAYATDKKNCYNGSIFGILSGSVKNLGIVDVNIDTPQGTGGLAAYGGHSSATGVEVENVFVTGNIKCTTYAGGLFGTMGNDVTIKNSFVNVKLSSTEANTSAALVGRPEGSSYTVTVNNTYAAGTVAENNALLFGEKRSNKTSPAINVTDVVAFNTGSAVTSGTTVTGTVTMANTSETQKAGYDAVAAWNGFTAEQLVYGLPGLAAFNYAVAGEVNTVKETLALADKTNFTVNYALTVGWVNGSNVFVCDAAGDFIQLYGANSVKVGDVIPAGWNGKYELYNGVTPEITNFTLPEATAGTFVPKAVAAAEITAEMINSVVKVENVVFDAATPSGRSNFNGKVGETSLAFRNNYTLAAQEAGTYNVTVVVTVYNDAVQLYPIGYEVVSGGETPDPEVTEVNTVAETIALATDTKVKVGYALTVAYANAGNIFACDEAGDFIQVFATDRKNSYKSGDVIPAGWEATYKLYKDVTPELEIASVEGLPAATEGTFTPKTVAAADVTVDLVNSVVKVENVVFDAATPSAKANFTGKVGEIELSLRNNYELPGVEAGKYNVTVVVTIYDNAPSLYVVNYEKVVTDGIEELEADAAEAVYYNLQGVEVKNPANGVYIVRRGAKVAKEYVR